ncbi:hypothetical protein ACKXGF_11630 [Alkalibacillus sp. S2W]|uniref:Uncharacterized protein n=1 Tax=Alkalibacillus salilacus TaxID=284582 RepID=A0ABT9VF95_9BACI|nr:MULTISPECIES: hypothetical protein [Alkalibacillus]MDQ0159641.1 hypothetical protein [Alkalibacillus salilacus]NIK12514.1 hypothetical protein [Alkalibacillus almallahensis]
MTHQFNCLECSKLQNQLNRQSEMISQLVRIVATTNERVIALEERVTSHSDVNVSFPNYSSSQVK